MNTPAQLVAPKLSRNEWKANVLFALEQAKPAVAAACQGEDGGTCNFDCVVLRAPKGIPSKFVDAMLAQASVTGTQTTWIGRGWMLGFPGDSGCGNARERGARAALKVLQQNGIDCDFYAQMD